MEKETKKLKKKFPVIYAFIIGTCVVFFWRGVWVLADIFIFPEQRALSAFAGLTIATIVLIIFHKFKDELV